MAATVGDAQDERYQRQSRTRHGPDTGYVSRDRRSEKRCDRVARGFAAPVPRDCDNESEELTRE